MSKLLRVLGATLSLLATPALACEMPSSEGREDLYGSTSSRSGIDGLNSDFRDQVAALIDAAEAEFGGSLDIYSGYRSTEHQQQLWDAAATKYPDEEVRDNWVARPGSSMHNYGLAVDISYNGSTVQYGSAISDWLAANMESYGLTRPLGNEGWHVEPIGARENRDAWMAGASDACLAAYESGVGSIPAIILMPWDVGQTYITSG